MHHRISIDLENKKYQAAIIYKIIDRENNPRFFIIDYPNNEDVVEVEFEEIIIKKHIWKVK